MEADILKNLVKNLNRYKAHKKSKDNEIIYETLLAHTELTNKYFFKALSQQMVDFDEK